MVRVIKVALFILSVIAVCYVDCSVLLQPEVVAGGAAHAAVRAVSAGKAGDSDSAKAESAGVCFGGKCNIIGRDFSRRGALRTARGKSAVTCGLSRAGRPYPSLRRRFHQLESHGTSALARR
jgi:hypothetical protein